MESIKKNLWKKKKLLVTDSLQGLRSTMKGSQEEEVHGLQGS